MRLRSALLAATMLAIPLAAKAQPVSGLYVGAGAGLNILNTEYVKRSTAANTPGVQNQFGPGFAGVLSGGYGLGNGLRFEIEGDYRTTGLQKQTGQPGSSTGPTHAGGNQKDYGAMGNVLFDFSVGVPWMFPYVGVGAGFSQTEWSGIHRYTTARNPQDTVSVSGTQDAFAYQAIVGVSFPIRAVPGLSLTAEGRFFGVLPNEGFSATNTSGTTVARGNNVITTNNNESAMVGIRYAFGVAPPPPPAPAPVAAPAPAPARTYLVFFDWDKSDLTDRAKQIIAEAATASTHVTYTRIEVNGYTDLSGTPQYNMGLSIRRANSVAAELVRLGVPRTAIDIKGFGETHPLVPTAQGVREPQNRRVEIILH